MFAMPRGVAASLTAAVARHCGVFRLCAAVCVVAQGVAASLTAAQFLVEECARRPGQVTVLALGPLTNLAMAMQLDPAFTDNMVRGDRI